MRVSTIVMVAASVFAVEARSQPITPTFDLTGSWTSAGGGTLQIFQEGTKITVLFVGPDTAHHYLATYLNATSTIGVQTRVTRATGCATAMLETMTVSSKDSVSVSAVDLDGNCDLGKGQQFSDVLTRIF